MQVNGGEVKACLNMEVALDCYSIVTFQASTFSTVRMAMSGRVKFPLSCPKWDEAVKYRELS